MDRRSYQPSSEGLEGRALLSLFGMSSATKSMLQGSTQVVDQTPETFVGKQLRIERLPYFLDSFQHGRFLPKDTITHLQGDLLSIAAKLHPPVSQALGEFNRIERDVIPHATLQQGDVQQLNHAVGVIVSQTGAPAATVANIQSDLLNLAKVDANSRNPAFLAANDYSTVLEVILGVGRPIVRPSRPTLAASDQAHVKNEPGLTGNHQFTLVGTYKTGATILITSSDGRVLGAAPTDSQGKYRVKVAEPLPDGKYVLQLRAVDNFGNFSPLSQKFAVRVVTGPHARAAAGPLVQQTVSAPSGPLKLKTGGA